MRCIQDTLYVYTRTRVDARTRNCIMTRAQVTFALTLKTHAATAGLSVCAAVSLNTRSHAQSSINWRERRVTLPGLSQGQYASDHAAESIFPLVRRTVELGAGTPNEMPNCPKCDKPVYFGKMTIILSRRQDVETGITSTGRKFSMLRRVYLVKIVVNEYQNL